MAIGVFFLEKPSWSRDGTALLTAGAAEAQKPVIATNVKHVVCVA